MFRPTGPGSGTCSLNHEIRMFQDALLVESRKTFEVVWLLDDSCVRHLVHVISKDSVYELLRFH